PPMTAMGHSSPRVLLAGIGLSTAKPKKLLSRVSVPASILRGFADMRIRRRTVPLPGRIVLNRLTAYENQFVGKVKARRRCRECPATTGVAANSFGAARRRP